MKTETKKTVVLGIGNLLMRDEGAGVHAVGVLRENFSFPPGVTVMDGGTMGLDLLYFLEGADRLLMMDAVASGAQPGAVRMFEGSEIPPSAWGKYSVHQIGLQDLVTAMRLTGQEPPEICLAGIEPKEVRLDIGLSAEVEAGLPALIDAVVKKLDNWGVKAIPEKKTDLKFEISNLRLT
ncbi:MAG: HyaD/HybD family hydrogenase maturation endopeptidase [Actinomycetota bacterium]|nr:HyaD/HybD family hydrogenase maturation endopeptidase [Actinomycetota bacterium]